MQFSKTSKKTRKAAEETAALPDAATQGESSKPRTTRSSKSKSIETSETGSIKHHKSATKSLGAEQAVPAVTHEQVAALAYSYWAARGYASGSPEQDWLRAERELKAKL